MSSRLPAPVQRSHAGQVSMAVAKAAYRDYARRHGTTQSLERLLERGGFSWAELVVHLYSELTQTREPFGDLVEVGDR